MPRATVYYVRGVVRYGAEKTVLHAERAKPDRSPLLAGDIAGVERHKIRGVLRDAPVLYGGSG